MKFSYKKSNIKPAPGFETGVLYQPKIPVVLVGPTGELRFDALVDTGSDQTIFPLIDVEHITGLFIDRAITSEVRGRLEHHSEHLFFGPSCKIRLTADEELYEISLPIWFSDDGNSPAILGHSGFLDMFTTTFDGLHKELVIVPHEKFNGTQKMVELWGKSN